MRGASGGPGRSRSTAARGLAARRGFALGQGRPAPVARRFVRSAPRGRDLSRGRARSAVGQGTGRGTGGVGWRREAAPGTHTAHGWDLRRLARGGDGHGRGRPVRRASPPRVTSLAPAGPRSAHEPTLPWYRDAEPRHDARGRQMPPGRWRVGVGGLRRGAPPGEPNLDGQVACVAGSDGARGSSEGREWWQIPRYPDAVVSCPNISSPSYHISSAIPDNVRKILKLCSFFFTPTIRFCSLTYISVNAHLLALNATGRDCQHFPWVRAPHSTQLPQNTNQLQNGML